MHEKFLRLADAEAEKVVIGGQSRMALEQLEEPCPSVADVADEVGYADAFRLVVFQELNGIFHQLRTHGNRRAG